MRMCCGLSVKINMRMARKVRGHILFAFVSACVVGKNQNTPNLSSMANDAITRSGIGVPGSLVYICGYPTLWI